jgi:hypothetical protein
MRLSGGIVMLRKYTVNIIDITTSDPVHVHRRCFTAKGAMRVKNRVQATFDAGIGTYTDNLRVYVG